MITGCSEFPGVIIPGAWGVAAWQRLPRRVIFVGKVSTCAVEMRRCRGGGRRRLIRRCRRSSASVEVVAPYTFLGVAGSYGYCVEIDKFEVSTCRFVKFVSARYDTLRLLERPGGPARRRWRPRIRRAVGVLAAPSLTIRSDLVRAPLSLPSAGLRNGREVEVRPATSKGRPSRAGAES